MKKIIKKFIPPIILDLFRQKSQYGFSGNYSSWDNALKDATGYDNPIILEKVKNSLLKVKNGSAAYERDSVVFDTIQYSWPVLTSLLYATSTNNNTLDVLDFGGSLGSSYFQNKDFLSHLPNLTWNIVEQKNFVNCGKDFFQDEHLRFYETIEECSGENKINIILVSSTIQYLPDPYAFLEKLMGLGVDVIVFDRTTFLKNDDRITLQKVRPGIYDASYPAWFLNEKKFLNIVSKKYTILADFDSLAGNIHLGDTQAIEKGFILKKK